MDGRQERRPQVRRKVKGREAPRGGLVVKGLWRTHTLGRDFKVVFLWSVQLKPLPHSASVHLPFPQESLHVYPIGHLLLGNKSLQNAVA